MKRIILISSFSLAYLAAFAQQGTQSKLSRMDSIAQAEKQKVDSLRSSYASKFDSLKHNVPSDSIVKANIHKADSIQTAFYKSADSLQQAYQKPLSKIDSASNALQHKIDSLQTLKLPATGFTRKLDSIQNIKTQKVAELNAGMDKLKSKAMKPLKEVTLPPQMQEPLDKLTGSINNYKLPEKGFAIPGVTAPSPGMPNMGKLPTTEGLNVPGIGNTKLPTDIPKPGDIKGLTGNMDKINEATGKLGTISQTMTQAGGYADDVKNITQGNLDEVKHIDKAVESQVMKLEGADQLQKGTGEIERLKQSASMMQNPDSLKAMGKEKAQQEAKKMVTQAVNHFAGHEQALQQAMDKMAKLKMKYTDVKSMADLPKHPPNPLKGKPFIERIVPGFTFQILKGTTFLLDVNALAMYRIRPHWSAGAGWNERLAIDDWKVSQAKVYGPRAAVEFKWKKGINLLFAPELMNTLTPQSTDPNGRDWVWSMFVGIKKDFTVYKSIQGNTELLYNIYDPKDSSPYTEKVAIRFGFEFPMKKRKHS